MRITAEDLDHWAKAPEARTEFPELVRRLVAHTGDRLRRLDMPSGSGTDLPGFDGIVEANEGDPWVPSGSSRWELSLETSIARKAEADLEKRTRETPPEERARLAFVFATPRKWGGKAKWVEKAKRRGWREVRAYDAHDLVQWLEGAAAVALWFGELLGKLGPGLESVDRFFARWSKSCSPPLTAAALATGRWRLARGLRLLLRESKSPVTIGADSEEEAAAFAASVLQRNPRLAARSAVVTAPAGWQRVQQNPDLRVVLCAASELARDAPVRDGLVVLVPHASGDASPFENREETPATGPQLVLPRPDASLFARALGRLGIEEPKAWRLAERCGRSWSAFRRLHATDPTSRIPPWLDRPEARALATLALIGAWSSQAADLALVAEVAGRTWEEIERDLRILADLPDAPVVEIGGYWKAKAIGELFFVMAPRVTRGEVDRFLGVARKLLLDRYRAERRDVLARSLADGLVRLAVLGPGTLKAEPAIEQRVAGLVRDLLNGAGAERWRSLAPCLSALAEAAPDQFLDAVDLYLEAASSAGSDLAGALRLLGRSPDHLSWVADILCRLRRADREESDLLAPDQVLLDIFRPWFPQTNAALEERLEVLATLTKRHPEPAFELLLGMLPGYDTASEHARPAWRDAWLQPVRVTVPEHRRAVEDAADRAIELAEGNPDRLAQLVERLDGLRGVGREKALLQALARFARTNPPDEARLRLRRALCERFHRDERSSRKPFRSRPVALPLARLWRALAPKDPVARHAWLFERRYPRLPGDPKTFEARERTIRRRRIAALRQIHEARGIEGVFRLARAVACPKDVGAAAIDADVGLARLLGAARRAGAFREGVDGPVEACVLGALADAKPQIRHRGLASLIGWLHRLARPSSEIAKVLVPYRDDSALQDLLDLQPEPVRRELRLLDPRDADDLRALLEAGRPVEALETLGDQFTDLDPTFLLELLEALSTNTDCLGSHEHLLEPALLALKQIEETGRVDEAQLCALELTLLPTVEHLFRLNPDEYLPCFATLWRRLSSDPNWFVTLLRTDQKTDETCSPLSRNLWNAIQLCPRIPGQHEDGEVDSEALEAFVHRARELARACGRLGVCDDILGRILAHAPAEPDGRWPCEPVAALLDRPEFGEMRRGFVAGVLDAGEEPTRLLDFGGSAERELAEKYGGFARAWAMRYPRTAKCLRLLGHQFNDSALRAEASIQRFQENMP